MESGIALVEAGSKPSTTLSAISSRSPTQISTSDSASSTSSIITSFRAYRQYDHNDHQSQLPYLVQSQTNLLGQDLEFSLLTSITHPTSGSYFNGGYHSSASVSALTVSDNNNNNTIPNQNSQLLTPVAEATPSVSVASARIRPSDPSDSTNMVLQSYDVALNGSDNVSPYAADYAPTSSLLAAAAAAAAATTTTTTSPTSSTTLPANYYTDLDPATTGSHLYQLHHLHHQHQSAVHVSQQNHSSNSSSEGSSTNHQTG